MKTKIQPAERVDVQTEEREQVYEVSVEDKLTFRSREEAERVAEAIQIAITDYEPA